MSQSDLDALKRLAGRYIWWKSADEAAATPRRVIAQVMDIGDYADVQWMAERLGDEALQDALIHAQAGQFNERSWAYWHYRLGLSKPGEVPPLPVRTFA